VELAERLIRMFSFVGDTVYDPFMGSGTTNLTAAQCTRNSIGVEIDINYYKEALKRMKNKSGGLFDRLQLEHIA
jgi:DNA modification methylase